jgi:hypothetical protein
MRKNDAQKLLKALSMTIDSLSENQIDSLISGDAELRFEYKPLKRQQSQFDLPLTEIIASLESCTNRESARQILSGIQNKEGLVQLAKLAKVYVTRNDKREEIETKVVEAYIGAKLRTEAINNLSK